MQKGDKMSALTGLDHSFAYYREEDAVKVRGFLKVALESDKLTGLMKQFEALITASNEPELYVKCLEKFRVAIHSCQNISDIQNAKVVFNKYATELPKADHMFSACMFGFKDLALLFSRKVGINIVYEESGHTLSHYAAYHGRTDIALWLIEYQARIDDNTKDSGVTPLHLACLTGRVKIIKALLDAKAFKTASDKKGFTALHFACIPYEEKSDPVFRTRLAMRLTAAGCNPKIPNKARMKPSFYITPEERVGLKDKLRKFTVDPASLQLPMDIWGLIFKKLPKAMLTNELPLVSKAFNNAASDTLYKYFIEA